VSGTGNAVNPMVGCELQQRSHRWYVVLVEVERNHADGMRALGGTRVPKVWRLRLAGTRRTDRRTGGGDLEKETRRSRRMVGVPSGRVSRPQGMQASASASKAAQSSEKGSGGQPGGNTGRNGGTGWKPSGMAGEHHVRATRLRPGHGSGKTWNDRLVTA
jgi:hypothetical protein